MKKIISKILIFLILVIILSLRNEAYALSFKLEAKADITSLKPGQTVTTTLKMSDIDVGELGCNFLEGEINYDTNIFETLKQDDIEGLNNWTITYNEENNKFIGTLLEKGITKETEVAKVKLKVKENVGKTTTTVKFINLATNDGTNVINEENKTVEITIVKEAEQQKEENIIGYPGNNGNDDTLSTNKIPFAGNVGLITIIIASILLIALIIIKVIRYRKLNEK